MEFINFKGDECNMSLPVSYTWAKHREKPRDVRCWRRSASFLII